MDLGSWLSHCWGESGSGHLAGPASPSSSFPHFLSPWEPPFTPPHWKGPRKLPAIRVPKAWGAVTWSRPRLGLHGRGRGSGSPQIRGLAKTCHRWPHGPADPTTTPQGSSLAPPSAHPGDTGRDSVNPDWLQGRWKLQGRACSCGLWVGNGSEQGGRGHSAALRLLQEPGLIKVSTPGPVLPHPHTPPAFHTWGQGGLSGCWELASLVD